MLYSQLARVPMSETTGLYTRYTLIFARNVSSTNYPPVVPTARMQQVNEEIPSLDTLVAEFPEWEWDRPDQVEARLPLLSFLTHHDRRNTTCGDANAILDRVQQWLQSDARFKSLPFECNAIQISSYLMAICKVLTAVFACS